jgi:hypothetical protein
LFDFQADVFERPKLFQLIAVYELTTPRKIDRLACEIAYLAPYNFSECSVSVFSNRAGSMAEQIAL